MRSALLWDLLLEELSLMEDDFVMAPPGMLDLLERRVREDSMAPLTDVERQELWQMAVRSPQVLFSTNGLPTMPSERMAAHADAPVEARVDITLYWKRIGFPGPLREPGGALAGFFDTEAVRAFMRIVHESRRDCATAQYIYKNGHYYKGAVDDMVALLAPWVASLPALYWEDDEQLARKQSMLLPRSYRIEHTLQLLRADTACILLWDEYHRLSTLLARAPHRLLHADDLRRAYFVNSQRLLHPFNDAEGFYQRILRCAIKEGVIEEVTAPFRVRAGEGHTDDSDSASPVTWESAYRLVKDVPATEQRLVTGPVEPPPPDVEGGVVYALSEAVRAAPHGVLCVSEWAAAHGIGFDRAINLCLEHDRPYDGGPRARHRRGPKRHYATLFSPGLLVWFINVPYLLAPLPQPDAADWHSPDDIPEVQFPEPALQLERLLRHRGAPALVQDVLETFESHVLERARANTDVFRFWMAQEDHELVALKETVQERIDEFARRMTWTNFQDVPLWRGADFVWRQSASSMAQFDAVFARRHGYLMHREQRAAALMDIVLQQHKQMQQQQQQQPDADAPDAITGELIVRRMTPAQYARIVVTGPLSLFPWGNSAVATDMDVPIQKLRISRWRDALVGRRRREQKHVLAQVQQALAVLCDAGLLRLHADVSDGYILNDTLDSDALAALRSRLLRDSADSALPVFDAVTSARLDAALLQHGASRVDDIARDAGVAVAQVAQWIGADAAAWLAPLDDAVAHRPAALPRASSAKAPRTVRHGDDNAEEVRVEKRVDKAKKHKKRAKEKLERIAKKATPSSARRASSPPLSTKEERRQRSSKKKKQKSADVFFEELESINLSDDDDGGGAADADDGDDDDDDDAVVVSQSSDGISDDDDSGDDGDADDDRKGSRRSSSRANKSKSSPVPPKKRPVKRTRSVKTGGGGGGGGGEPAVLPKKLRAEVAKLANEAGYLVKLHAKLLSCSKAVAQDAGLSLRTDWAQLRDAMRLPSVDTAKALVAHATHTNTSFCEAVALVRNKLAANKPLLPAALDKLAQHVALPPPVVPRSPLHERPYEAVRILCMTPDDVRTDDMRTQWEEIEHMFGRVTMREIVAQFHARGLVVHAPGTSAAWTAKMSVAWQTALECAYISSDLFADAADWSMAPTPGTLAARQLGPSASVPCNAPDQLVVHAVHGMAAGALRLQLDWSDTYHFEASGAHRRSKNNPTGLRCCSVPTWLPEEKFDLASHVDERVKAALLARVRAAGAEGVALRRLLAASYALFDDGADGHDEQPAPALRLWAVLALHPVDVMIVSAEADAHVVSAAHFELYNCANLHLVPVRMLDNSVPPLDGYYRAVVDHVMRYPRITLHALAQRMSVGHAGAALLVKDLLVVGALRADVQPAVALDRRAAEHCDVELMAASLAVQKIAPLLTMRNRD